MENDVKVWLLADTHFGWKNDDADWLDDFAGYFEDVVIPLMRKEVGKNDILIHCGDVFENRTIIGLNTISRVISLFEEFSTIFSDIRIIVGNHDMYKKNTNDVTSLDMLKHIPNVRIYYDPSVDDICGKSCLFNPWIEDLEKQKKLLNDVNVDYIFGHIQIGGSKSIDRSGMRVTLQGGVNMGDFKDAQVYAGHIHIRQDKKNIHYVGDPYEKDRGDMGNVKGITVLDIWSGKTRFFENKSSPKFITDNIYDILNLTVGELKERWNNNRVELHVKGDDIIRCNFDNLREALNNCYKSLDTKSDNSVTELNTEGEINVEEVRNSNDYFDEFMKNQDLTDDMKESVMDKIKTYIERR